MKWDENGIAVCAFYYSLRFWLRRNVPVTGSFYRAAVPKDIVEGSPDPSQWGPPSAALEPTNCDLQKYFVNHSIIFG
jgi:hypothetical protein